MTACDFIGELCGWSNYSGMNQDLLNTLKFQEAMLRPLDLQLENVATPDWIKERVQADRGKPSAPVAFFACAPDNWNGQSYMGSSGFYCWPALGIPKRWARTLEQQHVIMVPDDSMIQEGIRRPQLTVRPCPDLDFWKRVEKSRKAPISGITDKTAVFVCMAEWSARANLLELLSAYHHAFQGRKADTCLVLIVQPLTNEVKNIMSALVQHYRSVGPDPRPPVQILIDPFDDFQLREIFSSAAGYVTLAHGDGFDRPLLLASLCGAPTMGVPFLHARSLDLTYPLPFQYLPVPPDMSQFYGPGLTWTRPDVEAAIVHLREMAQAFWHAQPIKHEKRRDEKLRKIYSREIERERFGVELKKHGL